MINVGVYYSYTPTFHQLYFYLQYNRVHLQTSSLLIYLLKIADWQLKARIKIFWSENTLVVIINNPDCTS